MARRSHPRAKIKKKSTVRLLFPDEDRVRSQRAALARFEPHDLREVITTAKANAVNDEDLDQEIQSELQRRTQQQMNTILNVLGCAPVTAGEWEQAFFHLASIKLGAGHVQWTPRRTNRNAQVWTSGENERLLVDMLILTKQRNLTEKQAIKRLARDGRFPYRVKWSPTVADAKKKREQALERHYHKLKSRHSGQSVLEALRSALMPPKSAFESTLLQLEVEHLIPRQPPNIKNRQTAPV